MPSSILPYRNVFPAIADGVFVASSARVIGKVDIGSDSSIWFGAVVRGDVEKISIGTRTNIQDGVVVHCTEGVSTTSIGSDISIGHAAILHGCTLEDRCFVGMGALVLDNAVVETGAMIAAGSLVPPGCRATSGKLWAGVPARPLKDLEDADFSAMAENVTRYVKLAREYVDAAGKT